MKDNLLSIRQASKYLRISYSTAWKWVEEGVLDSVLVKVETGATHLRIPIKETQKIKRKLYWKTLQECADRLGLSRQNVRYLCLTGKLRREKVCYYWRITPRSFYRFLKKGKGKERINQ